jgi:hypothetical protein
MAREALHRWALLRLRFSPRALWAAYEDDDGTRLDPPTTLSGATADWPLRFTTLPPFGLVIPPEPGIRIPPDFDERIRTAVSPLPLMRSGPHATGPIPLPIFVDPPAGMAAYPWEVAVEGLLPADVDRERIQIIRLARQKWGSRPPFRLPLRVLTVGTRCFSALQGLRSTPWYVQSPQAQAHGLQVELTDPTQVPQALRQKAPDVVVVDEESVDGVLRSIGKLPGAAKTGPRLVVFIDTAANELYLATLPLPPGASLLWLAPVPGTEAAEFLEEFFYSLFHDFPLHEAMKSAMRRTAAFLARPALLVADPRSNQDLRMSDALAQLHDDTFTLSQTIAQGDLAAFFTRLGAEAPEELRSTLRGAFALSSPIQEATEHTRGLKFNFQRETWGLVPLADAEAALARARAAEDSVKAALASVLSNPNYVEMIQKHQDRRVDVALEQLDPDSSVYEAVNPNYQLSQGAPYRLRVHVGGRSPDSLMVGETPPLDPLLPEPEGQPGHTLEVVVFEKDFVLLSPRVQSLYLPPLRGSQPVYFAILAPRRDTAELRIGLYHKNHLLQSFVLEAKIGAGEYVSGDARQVQVRLNFSRTARFTNLPELAPRDLGIGVNQDQGGGTHSFMFKRGNEALPVHLTESVVRDQVQKFRQILQEATFDAQGGARFATYPEPGTPPSPDFAEVIRQLADLGNELYQAVFIRAPKPMQTELRAVAGNVDTTIQVVRHDPNFAFPWPILYDFQLPQKIAGAQPPPVCMGGANNGEGNRTPGNGSVKRCSHGPRDKVYCIYGFWGIRHRVEQLVALGGSLEDAVEKIQPNPQAGVCLAVGTSDEHTTKMATELRAQLGTAVAELGPGNDLLDLLWQPQSRPAVLIVLGHLETATIFGEPEGPRIVLVPKQQWLQATPITNRQINDGDWEQPRTLVLLMACGSGATDITTLNDLMTALTSVGAAAVIGTECAAFSRLVSRFAQEVTLDVWKGASLGEAVKAFNRRLVQAGNPLAFVFNYIGDADLTIASRPGN